MSFSKLGSDILHLILEELDPLSLLHVCMACQTMASIVRSSSPLRYRQELTLCLMKDGPPNKYPPRNRLLSLLGYNQGWSALTSVEDRLRVALPSILGVSGNFLYLGDQHRNNQGWVLSLYELRSLRVMRNPGTTLCLYRHTVPSDVRKVTIDVAQNLMVLAYLQIVPPPNPATNLILHLYNLDDGRIHREASYPTIEHEFDWTSGSESGNDVYVEQVEICGSFLAISIRFEAESGEKLTEVYVFDWRSGGDPIFFNEITPVSFELATVSEFSCRLTVLCQPDDGDDDDNDSEDSTGQAQVWGCRSDGTYVDEADRRPPWLDIWHIERDDSLGWTYDFPDDWNRIAFMQICPNSSVKKNMSPAAAETLFYSDPSHRLMAFVVEFEPDGIPSGCSRKVVVVIDESLVQIPEVELPKEIEDWENYWMVFKLPDRADGVRLAGRRLIFFENAGDSATSRSPTLLHVLDLTPYINPLSRKHRGLATVRTIFDVWGSPFVRTAALNDQDISWMDATEDNIVVCYEREDQCIIRVMTLWSEPRLEGVRHQICL